jgi:hypothetical protein
VEYIFCCVINTVLGGWVALAPAPRVVATTASENATTAPVTAAVMSNYIHSHLEEVLAAQLESLAFDHFKPKQERAPSWTERYNSCLIV